MMKPYKIKHSKPRIKGLIYGRPGMGKTTLCAEAQNNPDMADVLFINIEGGLLSVTDSNVSAIDIGRKDDGSSNGSIIADLESVVWSIATKKPGFEKVQTVVCDSISELQTRDLEDIVINGNPAANTKHDQDVRQQNDYGTNTNRLKRVLRNLKNLPINVLFTSIVKETQNKSQTAVIEVSPALTDKVKEAIMGYMDFVWLLYKNDKGERVLLTEESGIYRAKTRHKPFADAIGQKVLNPKLSELYATLCKVVGNES